jgi:hypothetical protein
MSRVLLSAVCFVAPLFAAAARAGEPGPLPVTPAVPRPAASDAGGDKPDRTVDHLLKAAEHLEAAGLDEEAAKLRLDARHRAVFENALSRKESELECLQEEVDRLRALTGQMPTILVEIVALEVDRRKLGLKAAEFDRMIGLVQSPLPGNEASGVVEANPARLPLFRELRERGIVKVLAEPNLTTTSGRPANFVDGGEVPVLVKSSNGQTAIRNVRFGTQMEVVAVVRPNQRVRLQMSFELSEVRRGTTDEENSPPDIRSHRLNTEVEMQLGQTLTLGRLIVPRADRAQPARDTNDGKSAAQRNAEHESPGDSIERIVFVTPRLASPAPVPRPMRAAESEEIEDVLQPIIPAAFDPAEWNALGPPMPVLKRRTVRD